MGVDQNCKDFIKGGVAVPYVPKIQALPGWGGSDPCLDFLEGFVHMHWGLVRFPNLYFGIQYSWGT